MFHRFVSLSLSLTHRRKLIKEMALAKALKVVMMMMLRLLQILLMERRSVVTVLGQVGLIEEEEEEDLTGRLVASYVKFQMNLCQSVLALTVFSGFTRSV